MLVPDTRTATPAPAFNPPDPNHGTAPRLRRDSGYRVAGGVSEMGAVQPAGSGPRPSALFAVESVTYPVSTAKGEQEIHSFRMVRCAPSWLLRTTVFGPEGVTAFLLRSVRPYGACDGSSNKLGPTHLWSYTGFLRIACHQGALDDVLR